jgi:hypothetical protein
MIRMRTLLLPAMWICATSSTKGEPHVQSSSDEGVRGCHSPRHGKRTIVSHRPPQSARP